MTSFKSIIILLLAVVLLSSCHKVSIVVEDIPSNTPIGEDIYIVGNFNDWNPGLSAYQMKLNEDSTYSIILPAGYGRLEYKFTRGNWTSVEKSICGEEIDNRMYQIDENINIINSIESWADLDPIRCPDRVICIEVLPGNTPKNAEIAIASELNSWDPDFKSICQPNEKGEYILNVRRPEGMQEMAFKVTRGDLSNMESDVFGQEIPNRILEFGKKDTLKITVEGWIDLPMDKPEHITIVLNSIPKVTPKYEPIFMASNLNGWRSGDEEYQFKENEKGQYYINLPLKRMKIDYKITRDGWHTVEVDNNGYDIMNRQLDIVRADSIFIDVERWKDQDWMGEGTICLILDEIPENTPPEDDIYLAGNVNNWDTGKLRYRFKKNADGKYELKLPRKKGELEFKITRGSWDKEAINHSGSDLTLYRYKYRNQDTLIIHPNIESWKDLPPLPDAEDLTIVLENIPRSTPSNSEVFFASTLNDWDPQNKDWMFQKTNEGKYYINIPRNENYFEYKITRGGWGRVETDSFGDEINNRIQYFGFADTVYIDVEGWK